MEILLEGVNRKLLHQHAFLEYKANRAADKNKWRTYEKYNYEANRKLNKIARNLGFDIGKIIIAPNMMHDGVIIKNFENMEEGNYCDKGRKDNTSCIQSCSCSSNYDSKLEETKK